MPRSALRFLGYLLGFLWFDVFRFRRHVIANNLNIAFPEWTAEKKIQVGRWSVYKLGAQLIEFFVLPYLNQNWLNKNVIFEGLENIDSAMSERKGVYLLGMHMGSGDLTASSIQLKGYPIHLISKFFKNKFFNHLWFRIRKAQGVQFIEPHGSKTAFEILKAIQKKECVAFVLDQFMGKPYGLETRFFGELTGTAYGLALFVLKTKSPVVPVYTYEGQDSKMHVVFLPALDLESYKELPKEEALLAMTQKFNDCIESCIRQHPDEWMWVHRRWKGFHD